eukprot:evm.model.scf_1721.2 EVM.evm.TU.scf_1721.2   scf_1721:10640-12121(+)
MNLDQQSVLPVDGQDSDGQATPCMSKSSTFAFPEAFSERLWKSMRLCPKALACEKDFYLKAFRVPKRAKVVWKCVAAQASSGRNGKNGKARGKAKLQEPIGSLESDGGNAAFRNMNRVEPSTRKRKVLQACTQEKAAGQLVSGQSANTQQLVRGVSNPESPAKRQHKKKRPNPPEEISNQSNSCHKMMSNSSVGTVEHASSRPDRKNSVGSTNWSAHGSVAMSQNGDKLSAEGAKERGAEKERQARKVGSDESDNVGQDDAGCEVAAEPFVRRKLQRLVVKPLILSSGATSPERKELEDSARGEGRESPALNDEELAMQLHQVLNAPSLRSRARRNSASTNPACHPDSARSSKAKSCQGWNLDGSGSRGSDEDCACPLA